MGAGLAVRAVLLATLPSRGATAGRTELAIACGVARPSAPFDETSRHDASASRSGRRPAGRASGVASRERSAEAADEAALRDGDIVANPLLRALLQGLGWLAVALGAIGVVLPGWPTTPWLLVAAVLFARSSPRFYRWLLNHRVFGPTVRDVRSGRGLPRSTKAFVVTMIVIFAGSSSVWLLTRSWLGAPVAVVGVIGLVYVLRLPTKPSAEASSPSSADPP